MITAVFNSFPLIILSKLNYLNKAVQLFDQVVVPTSVVDEIKAKADDTFEQVNLMHQQNLLQLRTPTLVSLENGLRVRLGLGEAAAIALATEIQADFIILDDHAARIEATRLGLDVKGTLGLIKRFRDTDTISISNADLFSKLQEMNFRVKRSVFDSIFE